MDFHIPSLATMNDTLAFGRLGALRNGGRTFGEARTVYGDRSQRPPLSSLKNSLAPSEKTTIQVARSTQEGVEPATRFITPDLPKAEDFWTTADINSIDGRDVWTVDALHPGSDEEGLAFFCFDLAAPRDVGFTMSMRAADPGPSAFEIIVTGHVVSRHYTVIDRFISRTFTIPASILNAGRNALSISAIPGYHGIWIESAGIGPLA